MSRCRQDFGPIEGTDQIIEEAEKLLTESNHTKLIGKLLDLYKTNNALRREIAGYEERLMASEEYARIVGNYVYTCEYWLAPHGELIYISPSCERVTGYPQSFFLEDEKRLINIIVDEDLEHVVTRLKQALLQENKREPMVIDFRIWRPDETIIKIRQISQKVYGGDDIYYGRRASNINLTELGLE